MSVEVLPVPISRKTRLRVWLLRVFFKRFMGLLSRMPAEKMGRLQIKAAAGLADSYSGLPRTFSVINDAPGHVVGELGIPGKPVILYLHGGGFVFPAAPKLQMTLLGRLCVDLGASGFMVDYRLAPQQPAPAALDDCERAYQGLLGLGHRAENIVLVGDSAGATLVLCLLHRLRAHATAMPGCAICLSPVTDLGRIHAPPSRVSNAGSDALIPVAQMSRMCTWYVGGQDASHPEISPLFGEYRGFPPLYFIASADEVLRDDSVLAAGRARAAGVETKLDLWPVLPHAFLIFENSFAEATLAREAVVTFARAKLARAGEGDQQCVA